MKELGIHAARIVTFVGRLDHQKGLDWLLQTAPEWMLAHPETDLLFVGDGPQEGELRRLVTRFQLDDRVHFLGRRGDVERVLKSSDLFVLPSRWEGMPNVLLEAMAAGLPIISTEVEGVREVLGPGTDAQTVPFGDSEALIGRIQDLLADEAAAKSLAAANRVRVVEHFTLDAMARRYEGAWEDCLAR